VPGHIVPAGVPLTVFLRPMSHGKTILAFPFYK
jgi:hypothetical protein